MRRPVDNHQHEHPAFKPPLEPHAESSSCLLHRLFTDGDIVFIAGLGIEFSELVERSYLVSSGITGALEALGG